MARWPPSRPASLDASPVILARHLGAPQRRLLGQLHELVPLYSLPYIQMFYNGVATSDKLIQTNPDLVQRFANAVARSHTMHAGHPNRAAVVRAAGLGAATARQRTLEGEYDFVRNNLTENGTISDEAVRESIRTSAEQVAATTEFAPDDFVDFSFIRRAYARLGEQGREP